ncbi:MAG TPA: helix-turn-helix domain-containing protein [Nocardioides sp.]|uniref:helix-turn-helix domain-containing protein n=1 Tax=Nocardioides sp. TaxID=35761 RepID=UPI002E353456|nr:helix-turn-helix domain-containing protein [Nocardioides sp.]HEX5090834.1 helix-turn-helix domain-containing protein [Nocardioides sp.]
MSTLIRTDDVPVGDRLDYVREITAATWVPMECRALAGGEDYWGVFRASGLGPLQVVVMDVMPITVSRTPALIEQEDPNLLKMILACGEGSTVVTQDGRQARISAGEFALYDTRRPYQVDCAVDQVRPARLLTFMFPPSLLPLSRKQLPGLTATTFSATTGLGDLTSQFLLQLASNVDHYNPAEAARLSTAALEVLATRLAHELELDTWGTPEARRHALLTTVQAFIHQHLGDAELAPRDVAAAHHISLRSLHQLFHDEGLTVAGYIRQRRLERCRRDLADPALASRPVAAIAATWGFTSAAEFSRAFRAAHGIPPAEYRRSALLANTSAR